MATKTKTSKKQDKIVLAETDPEQFTAKELHLMLMAGRQVADLYDDNYMYLLEVMDSLYEMVEEALVSGKLGERFEKEAAEALGAYEQFHDGMHKELVTQVGAPSDD